MSTYTQETEIKKNDNRKERAKQKEGIKTGYYDKHGKSIWKGDTVKCNRYNKGLWKGINQGVVASEKPDGRGYIYLKTDGEKYTYRAPNTLEVRSSKQEDESE